MNRWLIVAVLLCGCQQAPRTHEVAIRNFSFVPDTVRITAGDTVVFRNEDFVPHTATAAAKAWDSGDIAANASWSSAAFTRGVHEYICVMHPTMKAVLIVE